MTGDALWDGLAAAIKQVQQQPMQPQRHVWRVNHGVTKQRPITNLHANTEWDTPAMRQKQKQKRGDREQPVMVIATMGGEISYRAEATRRNQQSTATTTKCCLALETRLEQR